jgi:excisionase family DNA binding protein
MDKLILTTEEELKNLIIISVQAALDQRAVSTQFDNEKRLGAKYLTVSEAAQYLNLAKQTLYGFTSSRTIPFIKRAKRLLFTKEDLDAWLAQGKKQSVQELRAAAIKGGRRPPP